MNIPIDQFQGFLCATNIDSGTVTVPFVPVPAIGEGVSRRNSCVSDFPQEDIIDDVEVVEAVEVVEPESKLDEAKDKIEDAKEHVEDKADEVKDKVEDTLG